MKIFGLEIKRAKKETQARNYHAGVGSGVYGNWIATNTTADVDIRRDLKTIRARSRQLMRDDDYAKKFKRLLKTNVIGNVGIRLQSKSKKTDGSLDKKANEIIETAFKQWSKKGTCDVSGKYSFREIQRVVLGQIATDGEVIIRKVKGFNNKFGFSLQLLEADHLDENFNDSSRNIEMGIEFDKWGKPIAYHLFKTHPGRLSNSTFERERISADEIIHLYLHERVSANRGIPWMHTAMNRLKMLNGYEEAELIGARIGATKGGFYTYSDGSGEYTGDNTDDNGNIVNEIEPGQFELLPRGVDFKPYDPQHPTTAYKDFLKAVLRGISAGLDVSYNSLANDLESVNYSSLRAGTIEEREVWKELQSWLMENMLDDIFADWLEMSLLMNAVKLHFSSFDRLNNPYWLARGYTWVDPLKDMQSNVLANKEGLKTHTQIANELGMDLEELYEQLEKEKELRKQYGITTMGEAEIINLIGSSSYDEE